MAIPDVSQVGIDVTKQPPEYRITICTANARSAVRAALQPYVDANALTMLIETDQRVLSASRIDISEMLAEQS